MSRSLSRLQVSGYKSIRELDLELPALTVLIGANGAGKSNLISLFEMLRHLIEENLRGYVARAGGADAFLHFGRSVTDSLAIGLTFGDNGYNCVLEPNPEDRLVFADEIVRLYAPQKFDTPFSESLGKDHAETKLNVVAQQEPYKTAYQTLKSMKDWRVYHFHDTSPKARMKQTVYLHDNLYLHSDAANLAAMLYLLQETQPDYYRKIVETIQLVAPFFDDFVLQPNPLNPDTILLRWRECGVEDIFSAAYLSDGTLRFMCLATLLLQPNLPATIIIDEPELGLHPYAIKVLAGLLCGAATETQVVVSTQSPILVDQFTPEDILVVDRTDGQSVFSRKNSNDLEIWLEDYKLGELWEQNFLGGRPI